MKLISGIALVLTGLVTAPASAQSSSATSASALAPNFAAQLGPNARARYKDVFVSVRSGQWDVAQAGLDSLPEGPLHAIAWAERYLGEG